MGWVVQIRPPLYFFSPFTKVCGGPPLPGLALSACLPGCLPDCGCPAFWLKPHPSPPPHAIYCKKCSLLAPSSSPSSLFITHHNPTTLSLLFICSHSLTHHRTYRIAHTTPRVTCIHTNNKNDSIEAAHARTANHHRDRIP